MKSGGWGSKVDVDVESRSSEEVGQYDSDSESRPQIRERSRRCSHTRPNNANALWCQ